MRVDDLTCHGRANPDVACGAPVLRVGPYVGEVLLAVSVAADAEVFPLHGGEAEAVVVVVARRAQATAQRPGNRITDEPSRHRDVRHAGTLRIGRFGESLSAERRPQSPLAVQRALSSAGEVLAGQGLLVLGLVTAPALAVPDRLREVGMAPRRVALPTTNALGRVTTLGVVDGGRPRVAGHTVFSIGDDSRACFRVGPRRPRYQKAAGGPRHDQSHECGPREPGGLERDRYRRTPTAIVAFGGRGRHHSSFLRARGGPARLVGILPDPADCWI